MVAPLCVKLIGCDIFFIKSHIIANCYVVGINVGIYLPTTNPNPSPYLRLARRSFFFLRDLGLLL